MTRHSNVGNGGTVCLSQSTVLYALMCTTRYECIVATLMRILLAGTYFEENLSIRFWSAALLQARHDADFRWSMPPRRR